MYHAGVCVHFRPNYNYRVSTQISANISKWTGEENQTSARSIKWVLRFWPIWILKWVHLVCTLIDWSQLEGKKTLVVSSFCASHPRDATRRISATLQPSTQMVVSSSSASSRPSSRCCCQHLKNGRELLLLRSVSSVATGDDSVPRRWAVDGFFFSERVSASRSVITKSPFVWDTNAGNECLERAAGVTHLIANGFSSIRAVGFVLSDRDPQNMLPSYLYLYKN